MCLVPSWTPILASLTFSLSIKGLWKREKAPSSYQSLSMGQCTLQNRELKPPLHKPGFGDSVLAMETILPACRVLIVWAIPELGSGFPPLWPLDGCVAKNSSSYCYSMQKAAFKMWTQKTHGCLTPPASISHPSHSVLLTLIQPPFKGEETSWSILSSLGLSSNKEFSERALRPLWFPQNCSPLFSPLWIILAFECVFILEKE